MRTRTSRFTLVLVLFTTMFAAGCRDEVATRLDEIEAVQQDILALLEQRLEHAAATVAAAEATEESATIALENTGLALDDSGRRWRNKTGVIPCREGVGARWDTLCSTWREARRGVRRANSAHEEAQTTLDNRANRYARQLARFRRAHGDNTWDLMGPPGATGRSIVIAHLRELQDERTRLEDLAAESQP